MEDSAGRVRLHPLPSWSPESNPVELVWWSLHEAVSRNHECAGLDDLVELAEGYLGKRQPFKLKLGNVYEQLERPPPEIGRVSIYLVELSSTAGVEVCGQQGVDCKLPSRGQQSNGADSVWERTETRT